MPKAQDSQILKQSKEAEEVKNDTLDLIREDYENRNQTFSFFRNVNLSEYTNTGRQQFIGWREKPSWKEDYQYNVFDPITRGKIMAVISKTSGYYEAQFFNTNKRFAEVSELIAIVLQAFYKDASRRLHEKAKNRLLMLSALTTPKAIWYEGWRLQKRKFNEIIKRDKKTGQITETKQKDSVYYNGPYGEIIPVEDFIPGSMKIRDIQEQPRLTWITSMPKTLFDSLFLSEKYPEAQKVKTSGELMTEDITEFSVRDDVGDNEIEVARFFDKWDDKYHIIANNILLTKPKLSPFPFKHKDYPFCWAGFEELSPHFIYDMPLSIKLMDMQDVTNEVLNLTLDMIWRALNEVVLVGQNDEINDDILYAGGFASVNNPANFQKLQFGSSFAFTGAINLLERVKQSIEGASVDTVLQGQAGAGRQITAREVMVAREAAIEISSLFLENMEDLERDKAILRVKNQLDRFSSPIDWEKTLGEKLAKKAIPLFRNLTVRNTRLSHNYSGILDINIKDNLTRDENLLNQENLRIPERSQTIDISPEFIRQIEFESEIIVNSAIKKSKSQEITEAENYFANSLKVPQVLNVKKAAEDYIKTLGKNPDENLVQQDETDIAGAFAEIGKREMPKIPSLQKEELEV